MSDPKVLFYDIESSPLIGYAWSPWKTNLIKLQQDWNLLSVAWKWQGSKDVQCLALPDYTDDMTDDSAVAELIRELWDEADVVVAHNGDNFDQPKSRARMLYWNIDPPGSFKTVDTLKVARSQFKMTYNRLDEVARYLGVARKGSHQGFSLWEKCMAGDPKAWAQMVKYNKQDVRVLEAVYNKLRPWDVRHPNMALMSDRPSACPKCLAPKSLIVHGWRYYQVTKRPQYQCKKCRAIVYGRHIVKDDVHHVN